MERVDRRRTKERFRRREEDQEERDRVSSPEYWNFDGNHPTVRGR